MMKYRHELKYYLSYTDYINLRNRMIATVPRDPHAGDTGIYFIRSLYFDDPAESALCEKLDGVDMRDKFRIRFYNMDCERFKLERKRKTAGYICKDSLSLTKKECEAILNRDYSFLLRRSERFAHEMFIEFTTKYLLPKVIVDYDREPFVFPYEDVRITFDTDIRTAYMATNLFDAELPTYHVIENNMPVLEVKFNKALPKEIHTMLQSVSPVRSQVSKYCLCRKFEL